MPEYKLYAVTPDGRVQGPATPVISPDDGAALHDAAILLVRGDGELWLGRRLVGRLEHPLLGYRTSISIAADTPHLAG